MPLAKAFLLHLHDSEPERLLSADFGRGVRAYRNGRDIVLRVPGMGDIAFKAAVHAGLIGR